MTTTSCLAEVLGRIERLERIQEAQFLSPSDFANRWGLNPHTVRTMIQRELIPPEMVKRKPAGVKSNRMLVHNLPSARHLGLI